MDKNMKSVACCYLTHNHPKVLNQILEYICKPYGEKNIDIYICDSSPEDDSKIIVEKYQEELRAEGKCNLYYVDVRFVKTGDEKYLHVIQGKIFEKHYDYIWPTKDRAFFVGESLDMIADAINEGHDVVFATNESERWELKAPKVKKVYDDPVEFFAHYGQLTTNWEAVIRKMDTMVYCVDWDRIIKQYNLNPDCQFNQSVSLFATLAEMDKVSIKVINHKIEDKKYSMLAGSNWTNVMYEVWIDSWIPAIFSLPSIYDPYKLSIIKAELGHKSLLGSSEYLVYYEQNNVLTRERFEGLKPQWSLITGYPLEYAEYIMNKDYNGLIVAGKRDFYGSIESGDYEKAFYTYTQNAWLKDVMDDEIYEYLNLVFGVYKIEINALGNSPTIEGAHSVDELIENCDRVYKIKQKL